MINQLNFSSHLIITVFNIIYIFMNTYVISLFFINYLFHYFRMCTRKNERRSEILFDLMILYM
jgi:hypothetical protein